MTARSSVLTAACAGAVLGGIWGWLFLTTRGTQVRNRIDPALDRTLDTLEKARTVLEIRDQFTKSA
jgi:hypothetical protein